ncbi:AfsA-related hotdog domain-containing protein [Brenneria rubrifaciens]|nr:AfsA-related hotdog domain-containing protein [Brenneria rubrifaciens]
MNNYNVITPKLLHKDSVDDVLLTHPRKALPARVFFTGINKDNFNTKSRLAELYSINKDGVYQLSKISKEKNENRISFDKLLLSRVQDKSFGVPYQVLDMASAFDKMEKEPTGNIDDEEVDFFLRSNNISRCSTSFQLVNNADHYFFYRKQHEHVPGIMFMEAARQAIYYQLYTYSHHKLGRVTVSLSEMQAKFYTYGELMYPIEVVIDDLTESDSLLPGEVFYATSFYQQGKLIARITTRAPVISIDKFKLARNVFLLGDGDFEPLHKSPLVTMITGQDLSQNIVNLKKVSSIGCVTTEPKKQNIEKAIITFIYDKSICFSTSIYRIGNVEEGICWSFERIEYEELEKLKEMIKRGFTASNNPSNRK